MAITRHTILCWHSLLQKTVAEDIYIESILIGTFNRLHENRQFCGFELSVMQYRVFYFFNLSADNATTNRLPQCRVSRHRIHVACSVKDQEISMLPFKFQYRNTFLRRCSNAGSGSKKPKINITSNGSRTYSMLSIAVYFLFIRQNVIFTYSNFLTLYISFIKGLIEEVWIALHLVI